MTRTAARHRTSADPCTQRREALALRSSTRAAPPRGQAPCSGAAFPYGDALVFASPRRVSQRRVAMSERGTVRCRADRYGGLQRQQCLGSDACARRLDHLDVPGRTLPLQPPIARSVARSPHRGARVFDDRAVEPHTDLVTPTVSLGGANVSRAPKPPQVLVRAPLTSGTARVVKASAVCLSLAVVAIPPCLRRGIDVPACQVPKFADCDRLQARAIDGHAPSRRGPRPHRHGL